jgi:L-ascorbate metabolism protein UlaG (beta-lactamase superfamily)
MNRIVVETAPSQPSALREGYLAPSVKLEPLVDGWYAWPHLLAPVQQALNLAYRYLPTVQSFIDSPSVHIAAAEDPALFGGPFLELPIEAVGELEAYVARIRTRRAEALALAADYRAFDRDLQTAAIGFSLAEFYDRLPERLRGRVEIAYDLHNHPNMRLLEEMFETDDLGLRDAQEILLHTRPDAQRAFFLSTPRIGRQDGLRLQTPFDADATMQLCEARQRPVDLGELARRLGTSEAQLRPWFTETAPSQPGRYGGPGVRFRYFGHASVLLESAQTTILVDPTCAWDPAGDGEHFTFHDFPRHIDLLVISHGHQDHLCPETLMQLRDRVGCVVIPPSRTGALPDPSLRQMLQRLGYKNIRTLHPLESLRVQDGRVVALPFSGEHCDLDIHSKQCLMVELAERRICLLIDSDAIDADVYRRLRDQLQGIDLLLIGMECNGAPLSWLYGPLLSTPNTKRNDNSRRLSGANFRQAWTVTADLQPARAFVYAMGQEPWMRHLMGLNYSPDSIQLTESAAYVARCREAGIESERLYGMKELVL